jgi:hypothetical protein
VSRRAASGVVTSKLAWFDDSFDDNRDDSYSVSVDISSLKSPLSCLVMAFAYSWQCGGQGFESP